MEYKIFKHYGDFCDYSLKVVSFNGGDALYDIREWATKKSGDIKMSKGIRFSQQELLELRKLLNTLEIGSLPETQVQAPMQTAQAPMPMPTLEQIQSIFQQMQQTQQQAPPTTSTRKKK